MEKEQNEKIENKDGNFSNNYKKIILATVATIILGAIGSGFWEVALKPSLSSGRDVLLNIFSFGLQSIRNRTYEQVSRGFHEEPSMNVLLVGLFGFTAIFFSIFLSTLRFRKYRRKLMLKVGQSTEENNETLESKKLNKVKDFSEKNGVSRKDIIFFLVFVFLFTTMFIDFYRFSYVNSAITHYEQMKTIVTPYINDEKQKLIESTFAQVRSKEDYIIVIEELQNIAKDNNLKSPSFQPW